MKLKRFDVVDFLDSDEALVEYLNVALEENDPKYFAKALGNVARAKRNVLRLRGHRAGAAVSI